MLNCLDGKGSEGMFRIVENHAERLATRMSDDDTPLDADEGDLEMEMDDMAAERLTARQKMSIDKRRRELRKFLNQFSGIPPNDEAVEDNAAYAAEEFDLSPLDVSILLLVVRYRSNKLLEEFVDEIHEERETLSAAIASLLGHKDEEVQDRISLKAPLIENGILAIDRGGMGFSGDHGQLCLTPALSKGMKRPYESREAWVASLLGRQLNADLEWSDFLHLGAPGDLARRALVGWLSQPEAGLNFMLVGPPGTGKTQFSMVLAHAAGFRLWSVGEDNDTGMEPGRSTRLAAIRLAYAILRHKRDCMLLVDEATDVLLSARTFGSNKASHSKLFLNRIQETNPIPVLWACNDASEMDDATVRRMTHIIEMKVPDRTARRNIWQRVVDRQGLSMDSDAIVRLADRWPAAAAVAANAVRMAHLANGGEAEIEIALSGSMRALGAGPALVERDGRDFDPELTNCAEDLDAFAADMSAPLASRRWSACFYGLPGTGKSEFARHLATRMGLPIMQVRGSNLLSKYIGESEKNIAGAFAEARARGAMLMVDEIESLIFNRSGATHAWEASQVNEMLTWMEDHPLPFVGTTNTMVHMDPASLRRFNFKLRFEALTQAQAGLAFRKFLGAEATAPLPPGLTPGDFALVRQKVKIRGPQSTATLMRWLQDEADAKGIVRSDVGFRVQEAQRDKTPPVARD